jgi:hypothetical protein
MRYHHYETEKHRKLEEVAAAALKGEALIPKHNGMCIIDLYASSGKVKKFLDIILNETTRYNLGAIEYWTDTAVDHMCFSILDCKYLYSGLIVDVLLSEKSDISKMNAHFVCSLPGQPDKFSHVACDYSKEYSDEKWYTLSDDSEISERLDRLIATMTEFDELCNLK